MSPARRKTQLFLIIGGGIIIVLVAAVFTLGSLSLPFKPQQYDQVLVLFALSTFLVAALLVFGLILARSLVRLWAERRAQQPGSRFKTKMVLGAAAVSFIPLVFLFFVSYALLNHTLLVWFPGSLEVAVQSSQELINEMGSNQHDRLERLAATELGNRARLQTPEDAEALDAAAILHGADLACVLNGDNSVASVRVNSDLPGASVRPGSAGAQAALAPAYVRRMPSGAELWQYRSKLFVAARAPVGAQFFLVGTSVPDDFAKHFKNIETNTLQYGRQRQQLRIYKRFMLLTLFLFTLVLMFSAMWFAMYLSKQVTVPIRALAEATREISAGNFQTRVNVTAQDELGMLVRSFNEMTEQLGDSRRQIDAFTSSLQQAVQELERRRVLMETILENIPTGVISLDESEAIRRVNPAAARMFGEGARTAESLENLLGKDAAQGVRGLIRRSLRLGTATQELEFMVAGRVLRAAVTVGALGPRRANKGYVVVVDDLTELLRAQKAAAWQEVAQRIAHEIKNPLTPIQLSAQRLSRCIERTRASQSSESPSQADLFELVRIAGECSGLIVNEVAALESLVSEFSQFARFPSARLSPADANAIVTSALEVFGGRLEGIRVRQQLAAGLPSVRADAELLKRVIVNLIDNAAESMEGSAMRELQLATRLNPDRETVEIIVADSGHGISPEDKDKLFLPHFSTKDRGTGLGLAIASRIVAEHHGALRVEDNSPVGARFILQLPIAEVAPAPLAARR